MTSRFVIHALIGLVAGLLLAAGIQIGHNVLRYLIQPEWLDAGMAQLALVLTGLFGGGLVSGSLIIAMRRFARTGGPGPLGFALILVAFVVDPYFLAEAGWRAPALHEALMRAISMIAAGAVLLPLLPGSGIGRLPTAALLLLATIAHALLPRFAFIPVLGGDLDLAAMTPVHILVFARGWLLLAIAGALAFALPGARHGRSGGGEIRA